MQASPVRVALRPLSIGAALLVLGGAAALYDYTRVIAIFSPGADAAPLAERIAAGQRSVLFSHHADYAAANRDEAPLAERLRALRRAVHYLLDARLLHAWAEALEASGDDRRARHVAARLDEFHNEQSDDFFAVCGDDEDDAGETGGAAEAGSAPAEAAAAAVSSSTAAGATENAEALPFQCLAPTQVLDYRDFR